MIDDVKKKFIDILFESDSDDEEEQEQEETVVSSNVKTSSPIKAEDILYRKSKTNTFIDLNASVNHTINSVNDSFGSKEEYELSSHISPMFGLIDNSNTKKQTVSKEISDKMSKLPNGSSLNIVTSPIYGYASKEDLDNDDNLDEKDLTETQELNLIFGNDDNSDEELNLFSNLEDK